jgi:hypothetical protein
VEPPTDAKRQRADAVIVGAGPFFRILRDQLVVQAARHAIPVIYGNREPSQAAA